jgi:hypothetical protein
LEPLDLWLGIPVNDITFFIREVPGKENAGIFIRDPGFLFFFLSFCPFLLHHQNSRYWVVFTHEPLGGPEHFSHYLCTNSNICSKEILSVLKVLLTPEKYTHIQVTE